MRRLSSLWIGLILVSLLAACAGSADPTATPADGTAPATRTFGGGGNFILTMADDPSTLDPALVSDVSSALVVRQLFSGLVRLDSELRPVPDLAAAIEVSEDERTYTFKLRQGIAFADGAPITAEDVRWSLERATDPATGPIIGPSYLDDIAGLAEKLGGARSLSGVKVVDDATIAITLRAPSTLFLTKLTHPPSFVVDRRAVERGDEWYTRPNGSGPFVIDSWERRRRLELVPNLRYAGDPATLDRLTFLLGAEGANPLGLYEAGRVDMAPIGSFDLDRINDASDPLHGELRITSQLELNYVAFNTALPPFDDPKVREAFSLVVDRVKLAEVSNNGTVVSARGILPPGMPGANPEAFPEPRGDIARARQLLAESSYGGADKLPPIVGYTSGGGVGLLAELAKDELGVDIEIRSQDRFGDYLAALESEQYNLYDLSWIADYPDPQNFLEVLFGAGGQYNRTRYVNPDFDAAIAAARTEPDAEKRGALYRSAEKMLIDDHVVVPLYHSVDYSLVKPYVQGLAITPLGLLDFAGVTLKR